MRAARKKHPRAKCGGDGRTAALRRDIIEFIYREKVRFEGESAGFAARSLSRHSNYSRAEKRDSAPKSFL